MSIVRTKVVRHDEIPQSLQRRLQSRGSGDRGALMISAQTNMIHFVDGRMILPCASQSLLEVLEVKPRVAGAEGTMSAKDFMRSLGRKSRLIIGR